LFVLFFLFVFLIRNKKAPSTRINVVRPSSQHDALSLSPRNEGPPVSQSVAKLQTPARSQSASEVQQIARESLERKQAMSYYDGSTDIRGKIRQAGETAYMSIKFHFPPNFPVASKLLEVDLADTPAKVKVLLCVEKLFF
jgi:hypothetical protein